MGWEGAEFVEGEGLGRTRVLQTVTEWKTLKEGVCLELRQKVKTKPKRAVTTRVTS